MSSTWRRPARLRRAVAAAALGVTVSGASLLAFVGSAGIPASVPHDASPALTMQLLDLPGDFDPFRPCLCPICTQLRDSAGEAPAGAIHVAPGSATV